MKFLILTKKNTKDLQNLNNKLIQKFPDGSLQAELGNYKNVTFCISNNNVEVKIKGENILDYDLIYFRYERNTELSEALKTFLKNNNRKFISHNNNLPIKTGNKILQNINFKFHNVRIPKTFFQLRQGLVENLSLLSEYLPFPLVMKDLSGARGVDNYLVKSFEEINNILEKTPDTNYIFQEFIPNRFDYRAVVLEGQDVSSITIRTRSENENEHRNGPTNGAIEEFFKPEEINRPDLLEIARKAAFSCGIEIAGVDIIISETNNLPFVIEVNASPGLTINSLEEDGVVDYLYKKLNE